MPKVTRPITINLPSHGVAFGESVHALNFRMPLRADPFHKILYVLQGRLRYRDRHAQRELVATAGTLLAVDAGTAHQLHDEAPVTLLLLCLSPEFVVDDANRRALWLTLRDQASWHVPPGKSASRQFENLWRRGLLEQSLASTSANVAAHALAAQILVALARLPAGEPRDDTAAQRVERVAREMADSFYDEWTLDVAAARADLSRRRFSDLFRAQAGASFVATLTKLRLDHAAKLLRKGAHSVTGVAFSCGYRDLSHFYRAFRERYGCAPGAFAKAGERQNSPARNPARLTPRRIARSKAE
jgi:AraC-like DNA-binding protein